MDISTCKALQDEGHWIEAVNCVFGKVFGYALGYEYGLMFYYALLGSLTTMMVYFKTRNVAFPLITGMLWATVFVLPPEFKQFWWMVAVPFSLAVLMLGGFGEK